MPSNKSKKCGPRSHSESRGCVCGVCFLKGKEMTDIGPDHESLIRRFVNPSFSLSNPGLPSSICSKCRMKLTKLKKVKHYHFNVPVLLRNFIFDRILSWQTTFPGQTTSFLSLPNPAQETRMDNPASAQFVSLLGLASCKRQEIFLPSLCSPPRLPQQSSPLLLSKSSVPCASAT